MEIEEAFYVGLIELGVIPCRRVLEVGCGSGKAAAYIHHASDELCLIDISKKSIEEIDKKYKKAKSVCAYNLDISRLTETFDLIYYFLSFHHIAKPTDQLRRARNLLNENGKLVICEFYSLDGGTYHIHDNVYKDTYAPEELRSLLTESGFIINDQKEIGIILHNNSKFHVYLLLSGPCVSSTG